MGKLGAFVAVALGVAGLATFACGDVLEIGPRDGDGLPPADASSADVPVVETDDGGEEAGSVMQGLPPPCPPPAFAGGCMPGQCAQRTLYMPEPGTSSPWHIATDASYVYWLAQPGDDQGYNGHGPATLHRVSRAGDGDAVELARDQPAAEALALDGDHVYWFVHDGSSSQLRRVRRDSVCGSECEPEPVLALQTGEKVRRILRVAPGVLFAMVGNGALHRVDITAKQSTHIPNVTKFPSMTTTGTHVYFGGAQVPSLRRVPVSGGASSPFVEIPDGGSQVDVGFAALATDCRSLFGSRGPRGEVLGVPLDAPAPGVLASLGADVYDLKADAKYLYAARANAGGVAAVHPTTGERIDFYIGNVFALAVDDQGVYWGEHAPGKGGAIYMMVKD